MPRATRRDAAKRETREALIQAGMALFGQKGLDGPSLDEICEAAGFTRGAFYVHFRDRDDFLEAVMDRVGTSFLDAVLGSGDKDEDLAPTAERFMEAVASGGYPLTREDGVRPHQLLDACVRSPAIRARYVSLVVESLARIAKLVENGQRKGTLRKGVAAEHVAAIVLAGVIGAQTMMELAVPFDLAESANAFMALLGAVPSGLTPRSSRRSTPEAPSRESSSRRAAPPQRRTPRGPPRSS
jgi:TetR/AcrR family transcriptional repressor of nem operon